MKIALFGYGKMGKTIEKLAVEKGHEIVCRIDCASKDANIKAADVAIDFSTPEAAPDNIIRCFEEGIPVVSGTTGWLEKFDQVLKKREERNGAFIYASNFSVGVNLFFELNKQLAVMMDRHKDYFVSLEEIHHTQKKDAPSGTAITLAEDIIKNTAYTAWKLGEAEEGEIPVTAKREEDVKGTHIVTYSSAIDSITIKHEAYSRDGFALGAIMAAEWLQHKKGVFTMQDVLDLKKD